MDMLLLLLLLLCYGPPARAQISSPQISSPPAAGLPWEVFAQGEYVGPARTRHVPEYRLRVDDQVTFIYRITRDITPTPYRLNVGDEIRVESLQDDKLDRNSLVIQPDGTVTLRLLGQIPAAGRTVAELQQELERLYREYYKEPSITVTPIRVNAKLQDLRNTVDNRAGRGGQSITVTIAPDGTVQLPALGPVPAQGLSFDELKLEVDERYRQVVEGIEVTPVLERRAARFVYVLGEVARPGRYELTGPTSAIQAIALAGSWNFGGRLKQIVVLRRTEDWQLIATRINLHDALHGNEPVPIQEIWLRDSDIVLVPKSPLQRADDLIELTFGRGVNEILPLLTGLDVLAPSVL